MISNGLEITFPGWSEGDDASVISIEARAFLSLHRLPAVLSVDQTGWLLGFQMHEIQILTRAGYLKSLGKPRRGVKRYATAYLRTVANDPVWLARATDIIARHWKLKNSTRDDTASDASA